MLEDIKKTLWATADKLRANMDATDFILELDNKKLARPSVTAKNVLPTTPWP